MTMLDQAQTAAQAQQAAGRAAQDAASEAAQEFRVRAQDIRNQAQARASEQSALQAQRAYEGQRRNREQKLAFTAFLVVVVATVIILRPVARAFARRMEGARPATDSLGGDTRETLQRMEHAIDAMAIEIERISEGQRFTTKLLSDRNESKVPVRAGSSASP